VVARHLTLQDDLVVSGMETPVAVKLGVLVWWKRGYGDMEVDDFGVGEDLQGDE